MIPAIIALIPALVSGAQQVFGKSNGDAAISEKKHTYVSDVIMGLYDKLFVKIVPDIPMVNERRLIQAYVDATIEEVVMSMKEAGKL